MTLVLAIVQKNGKSAMEDIKVKSIYKHLKPYKWYSDLYDKIVEDGAKRWEDRVLESAYDPTEKQLQDLGKILKEKDPKMTSEEVKESNTNLMGFFSIVIGQAYRKIKNKDRKNRS